MKTKIGKIFLILFIFWISIATQVYAKCTQNIEFKVDTNKTQINQNEEIQISLSLKFPEKLSWKINTYKAKIQYDKELFEKVKIENSNDWENIIYNPQNGEFIATNANGITSSEEMVKIKLISKSDLQENISTYITISNVEIANSINNEVINLKNSQSQLEEKIEAIINEEHVNTELNNPTIEEKEQEVDIEHKESVKEPEEAINKTDSIFKGVLPQLGEDFNFSFAIIFVILIVAVMLLSFVIKRKCISKNIFIFILAIVLLPNLIYANSIKGDINGDGKLNTNDIVKLEEHLINLNYIEDTSMLDCSDINEDNIINLVDLSLLVELCNEKIDNSNQDEHEKEEEEDNKETQIELETTELGIGRMWYAFLAKD